MKNVFLVIGYVFAILSSYDVSAQLQVTANANATQLANTLAGAGVTVSNVTFNCSAGASGTFNGATSNIGLTTGVLLTSGQVSIAPGPNNLSSAGVSNGVIFNDPDLLLLDPTAYYDPCILEFDVNPTCNVLSFSFVFGSDEYHDYVNTTCNDVFGIFVTGQNPSGPAYASYNMANVPATTNPISINTVNNGNSFNCAAAGPCFNCAYFVDNCNGTTIQYDGFTTVITVNLNVVPCTPYHFKLAISDACDGIFDSGVFFKAASLTCNPLPMSATATSTPATCAGNTGTAIVTPVGGTAPYTYVWIPTGQSTQTATGLAAGNYSVTVIDVTGCFNTTTTVTVASLGGFTTASTQTNVSCFGGNNGSASVTTTGGTAPFTYAWSPSGGAAATAAGLAAGNYSVTITDMNGCIQTVPYTITQPAAIVPNVTTTNVSCFGGTNGTATATATSGTAPYTFSWSTTPAQTGPAASNLSAGTYTVTVTDLNGCTVSTTAAITQPPVIIAAIISLTNVSCFGGTNGSATVSTSSGTAPYNYLWSSNPAQTGATATNLPIGNYSVTVTDANGCTIVVLAAITQPPVLTATISNIPVSCFGGTNGSATVSPLSGTAPYNYSWNTTPVQTGATAANIPAGNYTVTVTDANGCTTTVPTIITQPAAIAAVITNITNVSCFGGSNGSATVSASSGIAPYSYSWNTNPVQVAATAANLSAGNYSATVTDANGCTITVPATVTQPPGMSLTSSFTPASCGLSDGTATVNPSGGITPYTYLWLINPVQVNQTATNLSAGTYTVIVTDGNGCTQFAGGVVGSGLPPVADFNFTPDILSILDPTASFFDGSTNAFTYSWSFGDGGTSTVQNPVHMYSATGVYCITLVVKDAGGNCIDSITKCLKVEAPTTFYIPNAFTPNHNGINDMFLAYGTNIETFNILIFDRWGNKIFESNDITKGWDGKVKRTGDLVQEDVYVWKVRLVDNQKQERHYIGHVSVVK